MSIQPPNGILDITGATLRVSKMEFSNVTGFDTVLNNVARNTVLHVDTTEYTANVAYAVKPPNMFMAQFDLELAAGGTGLPCNFNYYNDSNLGTSFNGYNLSFNDTSIILTYDGGSALHTATLSSSLNNGVYRKVKVLFDRDTTLVSINGENVFRFKDTLRPRTYDTGTTGYIRWWHNSPVARKIKNLKVSNGEKWAQEYDSGGLSSNISYTHGLVGVGTSVPEYTLDVAGDIRASGNLIVNGSNTLINTTSLAIEDNVIECGKGNSSAAKDLGFLMVRNDGSSTTNSNVAMFWDESTDALTFGFSDSGPTATTLTPNTTKTLKSYFVGNVGIGTNNPIGKLQVDIADASAATAAWDATKVVFGDIANGNSQGLGFGVSTNSHASIISLAPNVAWRGLGYYSAWHKWYINDVEKMRLDTSGNVGIGTATPDGPLHVFKDGGNAGQAGGGIIMERNFNYGCAIWSEFPSGGSVDCMNFRCVNNATDAYGGTPQMVLTHQGRVGIGEVSPAENLHIRGAGPHILVEGASNENGQIDFSSGPSYRTSRHRIEANHYALSGNGYRNRLVFMVNEGGESTPSSRMVIRGDGRVGIGTFDPTETLHVHENLSTSGHQIAARIGGTASSTYSTLVFGSKDGRPHIGGHKGDYGAWADLSLQNDLMVLKQSNMSVGISTETMIDTRNYGGLHLANSKGISFAAGTNSGSRHWRIRTDDYTDHGSLQIGVSDNNSTCPDAADESVITFDRERQVGIGTNYPQAKLTVYGYGGYVSSNNYRYFRYNADQTASGTSGDWGVHNQGYISIWANKSIITQDYIVSHQGNLSASDRRIKKNFVDADDVECLDILRLLKPKKYEYKDVVERGEEPVWGFIAQEVKDVLPYATGLRKDVLPNIYEMANVSSSNVITFTNFNTSNLESNATTLIRTKCADGKDHDIHLEEVIDEHTIRVKEDLSALSGSVDAEGNVITEITTTTITPEEYEALEDKTGFYKNGDDTYTKTSKIYPGNQLFVYGQEVDDFVFLKKESIWTVATAALQEVDRQLQAEKSKTATLETQVAALLARVTALENA